LAKKFSLPTSFRLKKKVINHLELERATPRSHGFHPSGLPRMCPVKFAIYDRAYHDLASSDPATIQAAMEMIRKILDTPHDGVSPNRIPSHITPDLLVGDEIHRGVQYYLGLRGVLWGRWECPWCRAMSGDGFMPTVTGLDVLGKPLRYPAPCVNCSGQNLREKQVKWVYVEPWIGDDIWGITGHADGILVVQYKGQTVVSILEIKSINENGYLSKYGGPLPKPDHLVQASQYVWCVREMHDWLSELRHIYFIYVNKNAVRDWKEYLIEADPGVVDQNRAKMYAVLESRQTRALPIAHRICQSPEDTMARGCPTVFECYGRNPSPINLFTSAADPITVPANAVDVPL
jgi:hypothetical protein